MRREEKNRNQPGQKVTREPGIERTKRPESLARNARNVAPVRAHKRFEEVKKLLATETVWGRPVVREWQRGELRRLYWPDRSYLYVDATGAVRSSGGAAARAKFKHGLR
jgi:hypothetical protein